MTERLAGDVDIILDLRGYRPAVTGREGFAELWGNIEPALMGRDLSGRSHYYLDTRADGAVGIEIARIAPGVGAVGPGTRFSVVAVRERPELLYRCRICTGEGRESYAPFLCKDCQQAGLPERVCDEHVVVLDGSLQPACPEHRPSCAERGCGAPGTFRCAGPRCRQRTAWCDAHRRRHPHDRDVDYCPACYDVRFPVCEEASCRNVGTVACEYVVDGATGQCGRRACTRHAHRWQVYGGERLGLGLCREHRRHDGVSAGNVLRQIVVASAVRRPATRPPTLAGCGHTLRNAGHRELAVDYPGMLARLEALYGELRRARVQIRGADGHLAAWRRQAADEDDARVKGEALLGRLRALVLERDRRYGEPIASSLRLVQYKEAKSARAGLLFVDVAQELRGLFAGKGRQHLIAYGERLGVQVRLEGGGQRR